MVVFRKNYPSVGNFTFWPVRPQKFFREGGGGGKRRIHYLLDQIKPYSGNQDFAKGFEPKVNMTLLNKMLQFGRHV